MRREVQIARFWLNSCRISQSVAIRSEVLVTRMLQIQKRMLLSIDHFRITFGLFFKASLGAHPFIWKLVLIHMQMKTNFHMKRWAPGLALKKRPKVIRKWPIKKSNKCARAMKDGGVGTRSFIFLSGKLLYFFLGLCDYSDKFLKMLCS